MHTPARNLLTAGEMDEPFHYRRCEQMYRLSHLRSGLRGIPSGTSGLRLPDASHLSAAYSRDQGVNVSTATACRQCEDAPCANVCPNGAISRDKGFVHVMQERCIGCKTCVVACPYGAMEVVVRPVIRHSGAGLNVVAEKAEANKCDLCFHRESGPACMEVCPTHALVCVDRNKLEQMNIEKRRRTALAW